MRSSEVIIEVDAKPDEIWAIVGGHPAVFDIVENKNGRRDWRTLMALDPLYADNIIEELEYQGFEWRER